MKKIYAASMAVFGSYMTPNLAAAFRHSKLHNIEVVMSAIVGDSPEAVENRNLLYELKQEGVLKFVSSHIPYGSLWDPACLDETERKKISARIRNLLLEYPDFVAPDLTLHAGTEPTAPHEREARISQACRTIEELLPTVEEINSRINVELLPRSCPCNCEEELLKVVQTFNTPRLGINFDLNHIMDRYREIPDLIDLFSPWLNACHVNDYDGVDEQHWRPGNGLQDWQQIMHKINALDRDILLIFEYASALQGRRVTTDRMFMLREAEKTVFYLENIDLYRMLEQKEYDFVLPGNE